MTDKEKLDAIRAEIHRLVDIRGYDKEMANDLFDFMDSLPNEPVSKDLLKASIEFAKGFGEWHYAIPCFQAGAEWGKNQAKVEIQAQSIAFAHGCPKKQVSEDSKKELPKVWDRETLDEYAYQVAYDLSNDWIRETPTWDDVETAVKLGAKWQKERKENG